MISSLSRYQYVASLLLRLVIGAVFLYHGGAKWAMWSQPGLGGMTGLMKLLSILEPIAALAVIAGFCTRFAALFLGIVMAGAILTKITAWHLAFSMGQGTGWEFDLTLLAACLALACFGPGRLSADALMRNDA
jgi:putative oxidoreductase